tara:strand:+ start:237 stop:407 length:171 start_codon:yes stop_codon:yes gene_type:complete
MIYECKFTTKARTRESRIAPNAAIHAGMEFNEDGLPIARDSDGNQFGGSQNDLEEF